MNNFIEKITHAGLSFNVYHEPDFDADTPWERGDGYGVVSEMVTRSKRAGELILEERYARQSSTRRYYDFAASMKIAKRDGWGVSPEVHAAMTKAKGRAPTGNEITAKAVMVDFERLRQWCNDDWCYVGVVVELLDIDGGRTDLTESLWGVESFGTEYLKDTAIELADSIASQIGPSRKYYEQGAKRFKVRP